MTYFVKWGVISYVNSVTHEAERIVRRDKIATDFIILAFAEPVLLFLFNYRPKLDTAVYSATSFTAKGQKLGEQKTFIIVLDLVFTGCLSTRFAAVLIIIN